MKNYTNIYDIDGNLIRAAGDNHQFTIEEIEKMVDDMAQKVKDNPDKEIYKVYLNNLHAWLYNMYNHMDPDDVIKRLNSLQTAIGDAKKELSDKESEDLTKLNTQINDLKEKYERGTELDKEVEQPVVESTPTVMDEYVEFEEV